MNGQPVSVGPTFNKKWIGFAASGPILIAAGLWLDQGLPRNPDGYFLPAAGIMLTLFAIYCFLSVRLAWRTVIDTGTGIVVSDRRGTYEFSDGEIVQTTLFTTTNFESAKPVSTKRTFVAWIDEQTGAEAKRIRMLNTTSLGSADPLAALIQRVNSRLRNEAIETLARGKTVVGEGWSIDSRQVTFASRARSQVIPLEEIAGLRESDGDFCIWVGEEELPRIRCAVAAGNAWLLESLLREHIALRPIRSTPPVAGYGRLLFEHRPRFYMRVIFGGALFGLVSAGPALFLGCMYNLDALVIGATLLLVASPVLILAAQPYAKTLRCYEFGVSVGVLISQRRLRYADAISYTEKAVAHFVHGMYADTTIDLDIVGTSSGNRVEMCYAAKYYEQDVELENLRVLVSREIAAKFHSVLAEGRSVPWTPALTLLSSGLQYHPTSLLKRPPPEIIPYESIDRCDLRSGELQIYTADAPSAKPRITVSSSTPNFHAGLMLIGMLCEQLGSAD